MRCKSAPSSRNVSHGGGSSFGISGLPAERIEPSGEVWRQWKVAFGLLKRAQSSDKRCWRATRRGRTFRDRRFSARRAFENEATTSPRTADPRVCRKQQSGRGLPVEWTGVFGLQRRQECPARTRSDGRKTTLLTPHWCLAETSPYCNNILWVVAVSPQVLGVSGSLSPLAEAYHHWQLGTTTSWAITTWGGCSRAKTPQAVTSRALSTVSKLS